MNDHRQPDEEARASQPMLYRLNSNQSMSSIFEEVEMAHEEVVLCNIHQNLLADLSVAVLWTSCRKPTNERLGLFASPAPSQFDNQLHILRRTAP